MPVEDLQDRLNAELRAFLDTSERLRELGKESEGEFTGEMATVTEECRRHLAEVKAIQEQRDSATDS